MKQVILTIALMLSLADTRIVSEDDGRNHVDGFVAMLQEAQKDMMARMAVFEHD